MRIGLLSDTHNHIEHVKAALAQFRDRGVTTLLHAGDVTRASTLELLRGFDVWIARGNMDRDPQLGPTATRLFGEGRWRDEHSLTLDGVSIALIHGDLGHRLRALIHAGTYAYVIHGHTHLSRRERIGRTWVINPGALGGIRWETPSCAILDLASGELEWLRF